MGIFNTVKSFIKENNPTVLKKQIKVAYDGLLRPQNSESMWGTPEIYPKYPYARETLYDLSYNSDTLSIVHGAIKRELFRNGYEFIEAPNTDESITSSEEDEKIQQVDRSGVLDFLENINENGQRLIDVLMEIEDDFSIVDDAFMLFLFEYEFNNEGSMISKKLRQVMRADPRTMGLVMNRYDRPGYNDSDIPLFVSPFDRENLLEGTDICPKTGVKCFPAHFFTAYGDKKIYYAKHEVVHKNKYRVSKRYGVSPVFTVWQKTRTLLFMDKYMMQLYDGQRPPKAGLFFKTSNMENLETAWEKAKQRVNENPHLPILMGVPDSTSGQDFVKFLDFMKNLDELQHTNVRNEFRNQVGAIYGVSPLFQADVSQSGGLNNEGLQITVTNRAVEYGQSIYNDVFLKKILEAMDIKGWSLRLNPSEEQDEMARLERQTRTLQNGQLALMMGLDAEYDDKKGEVIIKEGQLGYSQGSGNVSSQDVTPTSFGDDVTGAPDPITLSEKTSSMDLKKKITDVINKFFKTHKRKPSQAELSKALAKINTELNSELKEVTRKQFEKAYKDEMAKVERELDLNLIFGTSDQNTIETLLNQKVLSEAYNGITEKMTEKINDLISDAYTKGELSVDKISKRINEISDVARNKAETIARTEMSKVGAAARKNSYQKEEDFDTLKFRWIGPDDNRTTDISKRIKQRTKNGVTWDKLVKIVEEESRKENPSWTVDKEFPVSHPNSRHTFVRVAQ